MNIQDMMSRFNDFIGFVVGKFHPRVDDNKDFWLVTI
jgi:hypothetical protein